MNTAHDLIAGAAVVQIVGLEEDIYGARGFIQQLYKAIGGIQINVSEKTRVSGSIMAKYKGVKTMFLPETDTYPKLAIDWRDNNEHNVSPEAVFHDTKFGVHIYAYYDMQAREWVVGDSRRGVEKRAYDIDMAVYAILDLLRAFKENSKAFVITVDGKDE